MCSCTNHRIIHVIVLTIPHLRFRDYNLAVFTFDLLSFSIQLMIQRRFILQFNSRSLTNSRNLDFYFNKLHFLLNGENCILTLCLHVHTYTLRGNSNCKLMSPIICFLFINEHKLIIRK